MRDSRQLDMQAKMAITLDLYETALQMQRQNIRRRHPELSEDEVKQRLNAWLRHRPGAELGDAGGEPHFRPRKPK